MIVTTFANTDMKTTLGRPYNYDSKTPNRTLFKDHTTFKVYFQGKEGNLVDVVQHTVDHIQRIQLHYNNYLNFEDTLKKAGFVCV